MGINTHQFILRCCKYVGHFLQIKRTENALERSDLHLYLNQRKLEYFKERSRIVVVPG